MGQTLGELVSESRLRKYAQVCGVDDQLALLLYGMNMRLSAAAFKALSMCEIVLRNSMDRELRTWNVKRGHSAEWTLDPAPMLRACFLDDGGDLSAARADAEKAVRRQKRPIVHGDVVAQLNFGAWRFLLPPRRGHFAKQTLWDEALSKSFANTYTNVDSLVGSVGIAYDLRNRVAHHEPIFHLDLQTKRKSIANVVDAVSRDAKKWFVAHDDFAPLIAEFQQFCKANQLNPALGRHPTSKGDW